MNNRSMTHQKRKAAAAARPVVRRVAQPKRVAVRVPASVATNPVKRDIPTVVSVLVGAIVAYAMFQGAWNLTHDRAGLSDILITTLLIGVLMLWLEPGAWIRDLIGVGRQAGRNLPPARPEGAVGRRQTAIRRRTGR
jgi:hypothetical protein